MVASLPGRNAKRAGLTVAQSMRSTTFISTSWLSDVPLRMTIGYPAGLSGRTLPCRAITCLKDLEDDVAFVAFHPAAVFPGADGLSLTIGRGGATHECPKPKR